MSIAKSDKSEGEKAKSNPFGLPGAKTGSLFGGLKTGEKKEGGLFGSAAKSEEKPKPAETSSAAKSEPSSEKKPNPFTDGIKKGPPNLFGGA